MSRVCAGETAGSEATKLPETLPTAIAAVAPHHGQSVKPSGMTFEHCLQFMCFAESQQLNRSKSSCTQKDHDANLAFRRRGARD